MYERDGRRAFCPPALWLEPYRNYQQAAAAQPPSPSSAASLPSGVAPAHSRQSTAGSGAEPGPTQQSGSGGIRRLFRGLTGGRDRGTASSSTHRFNQRSDWEVLGLWGDVTNLPVDNREGTGSGQRHGGELGPGTDGGDSDSSESQAASGFSAAAVVRALLNSGDAELQGQGGGAGSPGGLQPHQQHRQLQQVPSGAGIPAASQPSALAAILVAAPQVRGFGNGLCPVLHINEPGGCLSLY